MALLDFATTIKRAKEAKLPLPKQALVRDRKQLDHACKTLTFPLAMKIISPSFVHKSDVKLVKIHLKDKTEAVHAYVELLHRARHLDAHAVIEGILMQEMVEGTELIFGIKKDPSFGPVIMVGLGGIFVEVYKDVSFRVCPITKKDAKEMLSELKGKKLLTGARGMLPADIDKIAQVMVRLSLLAMKYTDIEEIDLNPVFVQGKQIHVVDVRMLKKEVGV